MNLTESILAAWGGSVVDQYARKGRPEHLQPSLFEHELQPKLEGLGPGRWITIHAEQSAGGSHHGGHHVFVGTDGKMKTGIHAGQSMDEAFGKKSNPKPDEKPKAKPQEPASEDNREFIPLRERRKVAEDMAKAGKTQQEIHDFLVSKKVALVDARKMASDAVDKYPPEKLDGGKGDGKSDSEFPKGQLAEGIKTEGEHTSDPATAKEIAKDHLTEDNKAYTPDAKETKGEAKPGIIPGSTSVKNEDAKEGDQLGLFGEGDKAKPKPWKPSLIDTKGKQSSLFDTKGDKDQQLLFDDGVTPKDMVLQPEEPKAKPETPSEKAAAAQEDATKAGKSPRQVAEAAQKKLDEDYEFARASDVKNAGEDLKGSARHKVNAWKGLDEAEKDGSAASMVTRENLFKLEPVNLMTHADSKPFTSLTMHFAMRAFPPKPGTTSSGDHKKDREQYLQAYRDIRAKAESLVESAKNDHDPFSAASQLRTFVGERIRELRETEVSDVSGRKAFDRYNQTANDLVKLHSALAVGYRASKTGVVAKLNEFASNVQNKYGKSFKELDAIDDKREAVNQATDHAKDIMEGKSFNATFGLDKKKVNRFDPSEAYVKIAKRKGGRDVSNVTSDPNKATKHMVETMGLRGVQWGNTVTDEERKHHAAKAVEALTDLAEVAGLHPKDIALDGKLGLAIGARGKGNASAHYEPGTQVINLTRASGVGTLAHEWGHGFDHMLNEFATTQSGGQYMSEDHELTHELVDQDGKTNHIWKVPESATPRSGWSKRERPLVGVRKAYQAWTKASVKFRDRLKDELRTLVRNKQMSAKRASEYWASGREVFARTFEQHVQHKLRSDDRENSYLTGLAGGGGGLWPTAEESKEMAPAFDAIFEEYRKHKHGTSEKIKFSIREAWAAFAPDSMFEVLRYALKPKPEADEEELGCVMLEAPGDITTMAKSIQADIPKSILTGDGLDDWPHVTIFYGISGTSIDDIVQQVKKFKPVTIAFKNASIFDCAKYDVVKVESESDQLRKLNKRIEGLFPSKQTHPDYQPHLTLAYVEKGKGDKFKGKCELTGKEAVFTHAVVALGDKKRRIDLRENEVDKQVSRYWQRASDELRLDETPTVDRYDWNAAQHPRFPAGSQVGGEFRPTGQGQGGQPSRSSVKRELAHMPRLDKSHALHHSQLGTEQSSKLLNWNARMQELLAPMNKIPTNPKSEEDQAEDGWAKVDKNKVREMLEELNAMDREARANGVNLSDHINANQLIPRELAKRLDGGERFFNPEKLGNKVAEGHGKGQHHVASALSEFRSVDKQTRKAMLQDDSMQSAIVKALGLSPGAKIGGDGAQTKPPEEEPQAPSYTPKPEMPKAAANKLDAAIRDTVGDNPEMVNHFRSVATDAWKQLKSQAEEHNDALREIMGQFQKRTGNGALASAIAKGVDPTKIKGFDEMVDYAQANFPHLVAHVAGESESGSAEEGLVKAIRKGIQPIPAPHDDEVIDRALQMVGPRFLDQIDDADVAAAVPIGADDWDSIPFSVRSQVGRSICRYWIKGTNWKPLLLAPNPPMFTIPN